MLTQRDSNFGLLIRHGEYDFVKLRDTFSHIYSKCIEGFWKVTIARKAKGVSKGENSEMEIDESIGMSSLPLGAGWFLRGAGTGTS